MARIKAQKGAEVVTESEGPTNGSQDLAERPAPRSLAFAKAGIKTGEDFANTMSALMSDLIEGRLPPEVGNAVCNAGGKLLKVVEMQFKYAKQGEERKR